MYSKAEEAVVLKIKDVVRWRLVGNTLFYAKARIEYTISEYYPEDVYAVSHHNAASIDPVCVIKAISLNKRIVQTEVPSARIRKLPQPAHAALRQRHLVIRNQRRFLLVNGELPSVLFVC